MQKVFLNDRLVDIDKACISVTDGGFLYGAGLFETMRSYNGVVFALKDHLDRLFFSAASLSISNTFDRRYIADAVYQTLGANRLKNARLRLTLTSGSLSQGPKKSRSSLVITAAELQPYPQEYYHRGVLVVLSAFRQNPAEPCAGHKTLNYFARMTALNLAKARNAAEALWFTVDNRLAEGCISNVFLVRDAVLYTPPVRTPVLAGVARKALCRIAFDKSLELVEKDLYLDDLLTADEVFLTNVIMKILPISHIEKYTVGKGKPGPVTKRLMTYFDELVEIECRPPKQKHKTRRCPIRGGQVGRRKQ